MMKANEEISMVDAVKENPAAIFHDQNMSITVIVKEIEKENEGAVCDLGTDKGRKEIASRAHTVAKLKTTMDTAGKELNAGKRAEINKVDEIRRAVRDELDALKGRIRAPLDNWEQQEQARKDSHAAIIDRIEKATFVSQEDTSSTIGQRIEWLESLNLSEAELQEFSEAAKTRAEFALRNLRTAHGTALQSEAEREELERLRKQQAEREELEAKERAERQAKEKVEAEKRAAAEAEERQKREAAEQALRAAEQARKEAEEKSEHEKRELIAKQERKELERLETERLEREKEKKRAENNKHRAKTHKAATQAIQEAVNIDEQIAQRIIAAIASGAVPSVSITY